MLCQSDYNMWVESMTTEHMNQPSNWCGIGEHTSKLNENSVTKLVDSGCLYTKKRD